MPWEVACLRKHADCADAELPVSISQGTESQFPGPIHGEMLRSAELLCRKPEEYVKKSTDHPRFGGKQLGVAWPKCGRTTDTYFQKEHQWVYNGCKFNDRLMYATQQTKPTRGFMTSDYHRRCCPLLAATCLLAPCCKFPESKPGIRPDHSTC